MRERTGCIDTDPRTGKKRLRLMVRGKRISEQHETQEDAERSLAALLEVSADEYADGETLHDYGKRILEKREIAREVRDPDSDWSRWNNHIAPTSMAKLSIARLRRRHVLAWLNDLQRKGLSRSSVHNTFNVLRVIVRVARDEEIVREDILGGIKLKKQDRTEDEWSYLTMEQQAALLAALPRREAHIVQFAMWSGLRAGELCSLRLADVGEDTITVRYGTPPAVATKGKKPRRVPILPGAREALDQWQPLWLPAHENPHALLFPRVHGTFRDPDHVIRWDVWSDARKAIGWEGCWHDLRHTCAASLVRGWWGRRWSLEEVKEMLGHESVTTTERYAELADDILGEAARQTATGRELAAKAEAALAKNPLVPMAPPARIELANQRFRKPSVVDEDPHGCVTRDQLAARLLRAVAAGDPHALSMAVDLAAAVLDEAAVATPSQPPDIERRGAR